MDKAIEIIKEQCKIFNKKIPNDISVEVKEYIPLVPLVSDEFNYELVVTSRNSPNYKYRICFVKYYDEHLYPTVVLDMDEDILNELNFIGNIVPFESLIEKTVQKILNSNKVSEVIDGLRVQGEQKEM